MILNTEQNGAAKIQEDTENLKQEFEKLMTDVQDIRQKLTSRATQLEEIQKVYISSLCITELNKLFYPGNLENCELYFCNAVWVFGLPSLQN